MKSSSTKYVVAQWRCPQCGHGNRMYVYMRNLQDLWQVELCDNTDGGCDQYSAVRVSIKTEAVCMDALRVAATIEDAP